MNTCQNCKYYYNGECNHNKVNEMTTFNAYDIMQPLEDGELNNIINDNLLEDENISDDSMDKITLALIEIINNKLEQVKLYNKENADEFYCSYWE